MFPPLLVTVLVAAQVLSQSGLPAIITVLVYDESGLEPAVAARMTTTAGRVFERAGVATVWVWCSTTPQACPQQVAPTHVLLRIVLRPPRNRPALVDEFGVCTTWEHGAYATVFVTPTLDLAKRLDARPERLLGYVAAHEIGHLLLGPSHSESGVMRSSWQAADFLAATRGWLTFAPDEAERMRLEVRRRASMADAQVQRR